MPVQARGQHARGYVRAHVGRYYRRQVYPAHWRYLQHVGRNLVAAAYARGVGIAAQRGRAHAGRQMDHGGVAAVDRLVYVLALYAGLLGHAAYHRAELLGYRRVHLRKAFLVRGVVYAREHVLRVQALRVERRGRGQLAARAHVYQRRDHCGRAYIDAEPVELARGVARLHAQLQPAAQHMRRLAVEALFVKGLQLIREALALVQNLQGAVLRLGALYLYGKVAPYLGLAGQHPALRLFLVAQVVAALALPHRRAVSRAGQAHPALAAGAHGVAGRFHHHPGLLGRAQYGYAVFDLHRLVRRYKMNPCHPLSLPSPCR